MRASGEGIRIRGEAGAQQLEVTVAEVAAALRAFSVDGVDIVPRYPEDAAPSMGSGIVMVPWPNRVADGTWTANGVSHQLDISEVDKRTALHGLLRYTRYDVLDRDDSSVTLGAGVFTANGYPFVLETTARYAIDESGLTVTHAVRNHSDAAAPVALGAHPYFQIGDVPTDDLVLISPATHIYRDDERRLPVGREAVSGGFDLRAGIRVGDLDLDHCFTGLAAAGERSVTSLVAPDGRAVEVWAAPDFGYQVLLTTNAFVDHTGHPIRAVAIEPQTAAVDAFNSGDGLRWLEPGEWWTVSWGVTPRLAGGRLAEAA
ncbi:MAG TPA: aldose 1-epimerase family protein [Pseudolysinimonas sp.]|jgi:aldose 1-epimerase|nr:aldose 1-epimerase family protein [Pseudolysinimonas sp.]